MKRSKKSSNSSRTKLPTSGTERRAEGIRPPIPAPVLKIINEATRIFGPSKEKILSGDRHKHVVRARHAVIAVVYGTGNYSTNELGAWFGRNHTSIMYAERSIETTRQRVKGGRGDQNDKTYVVRVDQLNAIAVGVMQAPERGERSSVPITIGVLAEEGKHECANCGEVWDPEELQDMPDLHERLTAGDSVPSGDCPDCGAFCYPVDNKKRRSEEAVSGLRALPPKARKAIFDNFCSHCGGDKLPCKCKGGK